MSHTSFKDYFVQNVIKYMSDLERENRCLKLQMYNLSRHEYDDFNTYVCVVCNTTILSYHGSKSSWYFYTEYCSVCNEGYCNFQNTNPFHFEGPKNDCDCGLPHDCATRYLYKCCCESENYCRKCALKQIVRFPNKEYLQCCMDCIEASDGKAQKFILKDSKSFS